VAPSECRALQQQVRELRWLLGKKTFENEILHQALDLVQQKNDCRARFAKAAGSTEGGR